MSSDTSCKISVVVPVHQGPQGLADTVRSLVDQDLPKDCYEIIVVHNRSSDPTRQVARMLGDQFGALVRVESEDSIQSSYAARNKGVRAAKGEIIAFIDSDMTVKPDYLSRVIEHFKDADIDYLGCRVQHLSGKNTFTDKFNRLFGFGLTEYI